MEKTNIITEIIEAFKIFDGIYKREQVDAAIELKEEITPFLIEILESVLADPDPYLGSIGGVQAAQKKLRQLDLVEKGPDSRYQLVDPIFRMWLQQL